MPTVDCGFPDIPEQDRSALLAEVGPTVPVQIGFDLGFDQSTNPAPDIPPDLFPALVDTGASANSIDADLAARLGLPVIDLDTEVSGSAGRHLADVYLARIHIPGLDRTISGRFTGIKLASGGQLHSAIIGRSFLKDFVLSYDGRTGEVSVSDD